MRPDAIKQHLGDTPHMNLGQARLISSLVLDNNFRDLLELGFKHGVSSCYLAGALEEQGQGHLTTIDLEVARRFEPNIEQLLARTGLSSWVTTYFEPTSYTWRLMKMLEQDPTPRFDFCYLDGAHNWFVDGFAFFLVDRLLRPGGLLVLDDLDWTYAHSQVLRDSPTVSRMPEEERTTPQVRRIYELLVKAHPAYGDFVEREGWAFARKTSDASGVMPVELRRETVHHRQTVGVGAAVLRIVQRLAGRG